MPEVGRALIVIGAVLLIAGALLLLAGKTFHLGKLPGDIVIKRENFTFYLPITTSIIASLLISLVLFLIGKFR